MIFELSPLFGQPVGMEGITDGALVVGVFKEKPALAMKVSMGEPRDLDSLWLLLVAEGFDAPLPHPLVIDQFSGPRRLVTTKVEIRPTARTPVVSVSTGFIPGGLVLPDSGGAWIYVREKLGGRDRDAAVNLETGVEGVPPSGQRAAYTGWEMIIRIDEGKPVVIAAF